MPLNIEINSDYKIVSDSLNVIVQRKHNVDPTKAPGWAKRKAAGEVAKLREEWRDASYHANVPQAIKAIGEQQVRDSNAGTLAELLAEIRSFREEIEARLGVEGNCKGRG
ncbi:hypothetical protein [Bacillus sp. JJ722]|uniref:hypothetical protein n=1 Tax=Bacillus sp. JJ722 TaxID=3122973 RepID=UPI002FFE6215